MYKYMNIILFVCIR